MAIKVIGVGLPRTGTASLKVALDVLGFDRCYHMEGVFNKPEDVKYWHEIYENGTTDYDTLFEGFQSSVDFPGCLVYKNLLEKYPDAKLVLTSRDAEDWYESAANTVHSVTPQTFPQKWAMFKKMIRSARFRKLAKCFRLVEKYLWKGLFEGKFKDRAFTIAKYNAYIGEIRAAVPTEQLLEFSIADGWEPLCKFLDVPVPDQPFPHKNKRKDFQEQLGKMLETGGQLQLR